jgi:hypothetical protein
MRNRHWPTSTDATPSGGQLFGCTITAAGGRRLAPSLPRSRTDNAVLRAPYGVSMAWRVPSLLQLPLMSRSASRCDGYLRAFEASFHVPDRAFATSQLRKLLTGEVHLSLRSDCERARLARLPSIIKRATAATVSSPKPVRRTCTTADSMHSVSHSGDDNRLVVAIGYMPHNKSQRASERPYVHHQ